MCACTSTDNGTNRQKRNVENSIWWDILKTPTRARLYIRYINIYTKERHILLDWCLLSFCLLPRWKQSGTRWSHWFPRHQSSTALREYHKSPWLPHHTKIPHWCVSESVCVCSDFGDELNHWTSSIGAGWQMCRPAGAGGTGSEENVPIPARILRANLDIKNGADQYKAKREMAIDYSSIFFSTFNYENIVLLLLIYCLAATRPRSMLVSFISSCRHSLALGFFLPIPSIMYEHR